MTHAEHPLDVILRDFPGVKRISGMHRLTSDPEEGIDAVVAIMTVAQGNGRYADPEALRCNIRITPAGIHMGIASDIHTGELIDAQIWDVSTGEPMKFYFLGLEMCACAPVRGGPGVNPLCFALEDNGLIKPVTDRIMRRWLTVVRKQPGLFCRTGVETLRQLRII